MIQSNVQYGLMVHIAQGSLTIADIIQAMITAATHKQELPVFWDLQEAILEYDDEYYRRGARAALFAHRATTSVEHAFLVVTDRHARVLGEVIEQASNMRIFRERRHALDWLVGERSAAIPSMQALS